MPVEHVLEVAELGQVTAVPGARPELLGVRNVRGRLLPVADLAVLLGIARTAPPGTRRAAQPGRLLVAESAGRQAGFAVDEVRGVSELAGPAEDAESDLLAGAVLSEGDLVGVVDVPRVFESLERETP